jgi:hypothetical protein
MLLSFDSCDESGPTTTKQRDASWDAVNNAIRRLDQDRHTSAFLTEETGRYLGIGGGAGRYLAFVFTEDERNLVATDVMKPATETQMVCGGQTIRVDGRRSLDLAQALAVAQDFHAVGRLTPLLTWVED